MPSDWSLDRRISVYIETSVVDGTSTVSPWAAEIDISGNKFEHVTLTETVAARTGWIA